jgi:hypothetical protein
MLLILTIWRMDSQIVDTNRHFEKLKSGDARDLLSYQLWARTKWICDRAGEHGAVGVSYGEQCSYRHLPFELTMMATKCHCHRSSHETRESIGSIGSDWSQIQFTIPMANWAIKTERERVIGDKSNQSGGEGSCDLLSDFCDECDC